MDKQQFEDVFNKGKAWTDAHRRATLAIACFVIGWVFGKFI